MALLLLLLAATTAKADDCATTTPTKPQKEVEAYLRALYPSTQRIENAVAAFEALDYLYADRNILEPPRFLAKQVPPLPYAPEGAYYAAKPAHRKKAKWLAGANANRWRAPVRRRQASKSASKRASTVGGRFGPAPSWTNPLALVKYPFPLSTTAKEPSRAELLAAATTATVDLSSGYVEVEQFGGPRWTRSGCPPVCGTWANIWRGTGVFLKLDRPVVAPTRLAAVVELVTRISRVENGAATLEAFAARSSMLAKRVKEFRAGGASVGEAVAGGAAAAGTGRGCRCFKEASALNGTARPLLRLAAVSGKTAAFLARVREARPVDWCANVCGNGQYYDRQRAPMMALDGMLATLSCVLGTNAVVLTRSPNDNGLVHQELVDYDLPESLGGWPRPPENKLNALAKCAAPFSNLPNDADALLLDHWRSTNKWALGDVARKKFEPCDLANPGGGGDAWTSGAGRGRCRVAQGDSIGSDRACFVTCRNHISAAHANVSLTQVLRPDVVLCND